ncbi:hypothetical protein PBY51_023478 [Eleginops maclovinus]|nr:hypothetical protein PBY51_023478 [Eleginops maclovinus]
MAALGGGRDGRQLCSVLCNLEVVCSASELSRAGPLRAGARISHYSPLPLLARQPSRLLARDLILVLAVLCSPPCVIMLHKSKKQHAETVEDGERGEREERKECLACFDLF